MSSTGEGLFIPDLLLIRTAAFHPEEIWKVFRYIRKSLDANKLLEHDFEIDELTRVGGFVHEFVHYLQFTSTVQGVDYYNTSGELAVASFKCLKDLVRLSRNEGLPFGLPLDGFAGWSSENEHKCEPIELWYQKFFILQNIFSMGLLTSSPYTDGELLQRLKRIEDKKIFPTYTHANDNGQKTEKTFTPWAVLEAEAFVKTTQFLHSFFPDEGLQVIENLHGDVSDEINLAFSLERLGLKNLITLMVDFAMQVSPMSMVENSGDFEEYSMTWRFFNAINACEVFAGISENDAFERRQEIVKLLRDKVGGPDITGEIEKKLHQLRNGEIKFIEKPLQKILIHNLDVRHNHHGWFVGHPALLESIVYSICLQRVLWNHYGLDENRPVLETQLGPEILNKDERLELFIHSNFRWAGKQIATRTDIICPECQIMFGYNQCDGKCNFSSILRKEVQFDTTTKSFVKEK